MMVVMMLLRVNLQVDAKVSKKHTVSIFSNKVYNSDSTETTLEVSRVMNVQVISNIRGQGSRALFLSFVRIVHYKRKSILFHLRIDGSIENDIYKQYKLSLI
jgi:hypothetical protein